VGHGIAPDDLPKMPVRELAHLLGMKTKTVESHYDEHGNMPTIETLEQYMKLLPLGFASGLFYGAGFVIVRADEHILPNSLEFQSHLARTMHKIAVQLEDGIHTASEKREVAPIVRDFGATCLAVASEWECEEGCERVNLGDKS